jgi:hypothetical protein
MEVYSHIRFLPNLLGLAVTSVGSVGLSFSLIYNDYKDW